MTSKLIPSDPSAVTVIRKVTDNITTSSAPFSRFGHIKVGGRGTIVRMSNGSLAVFSPTALTPELRTSLKEMGDNVAYLTALDIEHHIFISDWVKAYPNAKVLGPEGLPEKREANPETAGTTFHHIFTNSNKADMRIDGNFDSEFDYEYVGSHANKEIVFCHKPTRSLIEADLLFNLPATEQYSRSAVKATDGLLTKLFVGLMGTTGTATWQKRFLWYAASSKDRPGFAQSMKKIDAWNFDRIIPCHGDVIETGGKTVFRKVMEWHLNDAKAK